ncbi:MAG: ribonucleoside-triphosphate reductase, adenosylcobalamin-dependent [Synechococcaceae cyanobacterium]|nr:ribonucleoside-triphosphate reductase, adenosylcobalamin-dependent [Synechococcaceae cyanobacterium]
MATGEAPPPPPDFPATAPAANPVFYRTYSRRGPAGRESWSDVAERSLEGLRRLGQLNDAEVELLRRMQLQQKALPSGRWLWIGGTDWIERPENFSGAYNCTSTNLVDWEAFALMMDLAMMGCGTGAIIEPHLIERLPLLRNPLEITVVRDIGITPAEQRQEHTSHRIDGQQVTIKVGDTRQGWVESYRLLLELSSDPRFDGPVRVEVDLADVRPVGESLKGFGGMANPVKLRDLYGRVARILNKAQGRRLSSVECCLLIDEAAVTIVAGNIRRSAGMRQFSADDTAAASAKDNLWQQDAQGNWRIDPERDALRMANHTRVFHSRPSRAVVLEAVTRQFQSGEGAIQFAPEAIARANADLLPTPELREEFVGIYCDQGREEAGHWLTLHHPQLSAAELEHRLGRYGLNPCVTADTWVLTGEGPKQVQELIGQQHSTYVNGELFSTTAAGFFTSGVKPVLKLTTREGQQLRLTGNHKLLKVTAQTQKAQYSEWVEAQTLQPGDRVLLHNHRNAQPWEGKGTAESGWLLGSLIGDDSLARTPWNDTGLLRFWGTNGEAMAEQAVALLEQEVDYQRRTSTVTLHPQLQHRVISSAGLARLAADYGIEQGSKVITTAIEHTSHAFHCGFLQGLFDADGSVQGAQAKGVSVRLAQSNLSNLQAVQRMLGRLGIVASIYQNRRQADTRLLPDSQRQLAPYHCQAQHELVIANDNLQVFAALVGFRDAEKQEKLNHLLSQYIRTPNRERFTATVATLEADGTEAVYDCTVPGPARFDANGLVAHNCGEILGADFHCNLAEIHLNRIHPDDHQGQEEAFRAAALSVACLLNHRFEVERYRQSRAWDPIVGVSFTGLFDFFVHAFGTPWLQWWEAGRPDSEEGRAFRAEEARTLSRWKRIVDETVWDYCDRHGLRRPNRCTTVQPAGTKSLLTGASPGWHPPKAQRFIRRITFRKNDPVALACLDYGYTIVPSQSDKDEQGRLLDDPFDPRCGEWLVEIPTEVSWANLPGADRVEINTFSALAQFDFYMQVQKHYTAHNTSATVEFREHEIEGLAAAIHHAIENGEGYISAALLARFDANATFPRLPFEPIDLATYTALSAQVLERRRTPSFFEALQRYDRGEQMEAGPAGCDSDKCLLPSTSPAG